MTISNLDRHLAAMTDEHDHYTQWMLDHYPDPISAWPHAERPGASSLKDIVGGYDVALSGTYALDQEPLVWDAGPSASTDGSTSDGSITDADQYEIGAGDSWTWLGWLSNFAPPNGSNVVLWSRASGPAIQHVIVDKGDSYRFRLRVDDGTDGKTITGGDWSRSSLNTHPRLVAFVVDRGSDQGEIWVDGTLEASADISSVGDLSMSSDVIYMRGTGTAYSLSHVFVWKRALTATDIQRIHRRGHL